MGKIVPDTNSLTKSVLQVIHSFNEFTSILQNIDTAAVCGGNPDIFMVETVQEILTNSNRNIPVYIDATMTVRHKDCLLLVVMSQKQCSVCCKYRNCLRAMYSKLKVSRCTQDDSTTQSSHTNYRWLRDLKIKLCLKNIKKSIRTLQRGRQHLNDRLQRLIDGEGVDLNDEDSAAISELVDDSSKAMDMQSFYRIFLEQQQKYRHLKHKHSMHWHPLITRFALSVKYSST